MSAKRRYELKERARRQEETRGRIVEATAELHRSVGPARTTVSEVARRAGVGRMTVYNHFPDEGELFGACSAYWDARHPAPDPAVWAGIEDPDQRLKVGLGGLYAYYREIGEVLGKVLRDAPLLPTLEAVLDEGWWPYLDAIIETLGVGRRMDGERGEYVRAALRLAVDFGTWRTLTSAGLDDERAAELARDLVVVAGR